MDISHPGHPFFSIIVPTYNRASLLLKGLDSILNQELLDYEVLVIDDGSVDETRSLMSQIISENPRVKYFYKKNEERSIARNFGISKARGKYVTFLDSDDILYSNHLTVAFDLLKRKQFPEVGHLGYKLIDESGNTISTRNNFNHSSREQLIRENIFHGNAIFIRKDIATEVHFIPSASATIAEDWYLWLRLAARYPIFFDNTITAAVVQHDARSLMQIDPDKLIASTEIIIHYLKKDKPFLSRYRNKVSYHFANHYTFLTLTLALTKKRRAETLRYLSKAISYDPTVLFRRRFLASLKHLL